MYESVYQPIIGLHDGSSFDQLRTIIWSSADLLPTGRPRIFFSEILIEIQTVLLQNLFENVKGMGFQHQKHVCRTWISNYIPLHYDDVIMGPIASQITSLTYVYSIVYSDADQRKHQSSASLAFVWGIHRDRWIPRTKGQLRGKCFHLMTSSWNIVEYNHFSMS